MAVYPTFTMEMGLPGGFRQILVDEQYVQGCYPCAELSSLSPILDISGNGRHGLPVGTGFTRGVPFAVAENCLGTTMNGNGFHEIANDGVAQGMSLDAGDMDLIVLVSNVTNDATNRAIISKQDTNSAGNGYHLSVQSLAVEFYLEVAGSVIFNFQRGTLSGETLIHACYRTGVGEAFISFNGVQQGATVTSVTTEPGVTTASLRLGAFADGAGGDGNGFKGSMAYATIGREGNNTLGASLQAAKPWVNVTADVRGQAAIKMRRGIAGTGLLDNVATPATLSFAMNNGAWNSASLVGYYSPGHANCRTGFSIGTPVRWSVTYDGVTAYQFRGRIKAITPIPGAYQERLTHVTAVGWLDVAANTYLPPVPTEVGIRSDEALKLVIDRAEGRSPAAVDISLGSSSFPFWGERGEGDTESLLTAATRIVGSERGYLYDLADTVQGGTIRSEGRGDRQLSTSLAATFNNTMHGLEVGYNLEGLANIIKVVFTPRSVDPSPVVLYALEVSQQSQHIAPGETVVFSGGYRDPSNAAQKVGSVVMQDPPVSGTDYGFWQQSGGTGTDLSGFLGVAAYLGGSSFEVRFTNNGSAPGYLRISSASSTAFQLRGTGAYHYTPATVTRADEDSVRKYGPRTVTIELGYESDRAVAESIADFYLAILSKSTVSTQRVVPNKLTMRANQNATLMGLAMTLDVGDKVGLVETVSGLSLDDPDSDEDYGYFINEVQMTYEEGHMLTVQYALTPSVPGGGVWVWDEAVLDETTRFAF